VNAAEYAAFAKQTAALFQPAIPVQPDVDGKFPTPLDGALFMASLGIPQTPLRPRTKIAFLPEFQKSATTDAAQIREWAAAYPGCNFGSLGREGEFFTFESDSTNVRDRFAAQGGKFTSKLMVMSRPGRGHRWYRSVPSVTNIQQAFTKHGDFSVRALNMYCCSPGSIHPETGEQYKLMASGAPDVPSAAEIAFWESERLEKKSGEKAEPTRNAAGKIPHGSIHSWLVSQAGRMRNAGLTVDEIEPALLRLAYEECEEPLDDAKIVQVARSMNNYEPGRAGYALTVGGQQPNSSTWGELQQLAGELNPVPAVDSSWLPVAIRPHVESLAERMSVPVDFTAVGAVCALAGCVGRRALVYPKANDKSWFEPITISGAVIADSGKKKTPTWKALMRPLHEWEKDEEREYTKRQTVFQNSMAEYSRITGDYKKVCKEEEKAAKKESREPNYPKAPEVVRPVEPVKPRRLVLNDSTPEQMHEICKGNPQGLFFERDELSGLVAELDMTGRESMRGFFLDGMTGDCSRTVDRIGREGGQADLTFTVFGSFQPLTFRNAISDSVNVGSGMIPRFHALIWPDKSNLPRTDKAEDVAAFQRYRKIVRTLASLRDKSVFLHFTKDAQQSFYQFQEWLDGLMNSEANPGKQSHLSKLEGGAAKIAALFQLIDVVQDLPPVITHSVNLETGMNEAVAQPGTIQGNVYIDREHFQMAWDFVRYLVKHMHRVYDSKLEGTEYRMVRLAEHIKDGTFRDGMTAREINRKDWAGLNQKVTNGEGVEYALEELAGRGWVREMTAQPTVGRPARRWECNPKARVGGQPE
jgi:hypothetical protein